MCWAPGGLPSRRTPRSRASAWRARESAVYLFIIACSVSELTDSEARPGGHVCNSCRKSLVLSVWGTRCPHSTVNPPSCK